MNNNQNINNNELQEKQTTSTELSEKIVNAKKQYEYLKELNSMLTLFNKQTSQENEQSAPSKGK